MILVTGSAGLIGRHLCARLTEAGIVHRQFDLTHSLDQDSRNARSLELALRGVTGVVHLAAVSRVVWAERDPAKCQAINVDALRSLVDLGSRNSRPWIIFASSREVYGRSTHSPIAEASPLNPINVYGRSKLAGEIIINEARESGLIANICRFSSVFGCHLDHPDRVAMAFATAAVRGGVMVLEGGTSMFDFTDVGDVVDGLMRLIAATQRSELLPPIHFVSGKGTTLSELAEMAMSYGSADVKMSEALPRSFDVHAFVGDPSRALSLLGWQATTDIRATMQRLVASLHIQCA